MDKKRELEIIRIFRNKEEININIAREIVKLFRGNPYLWVFKCILDGDGQQELIIQENFLKILAISKDSTWGALRTIFIEFPALSDREAIEKLMNTESEVLPLGELYLLEPEVYNNLMSYAEFDDNEFSEENYETVFEEYEGKK